MTIGGVSPSQIATSVWTRTVRTLTGFGTSALVISGFGNSSIASLATISFNANLNCTATWTLAAQAGAAGSLVIAQGNITPIIMKTIVASQSDYVTTVATPAIYMYMTNNDAVNAGSWVLAGQQLKQ